MRTLVSVRALGSARCHAPEASLEIGTVTASEEVAPGVAILRFESPRIARAYRPGKFVHLKTGDESTILRRPFSIARVCGNEILLLYRVVGKGTTYLRALAEGDSVDAMGPLGTSFDLRTRAKRTLLIGGGLGIAPLLGLAEALVGSGHDGPIEALLGVRSAGDVFSPALTEGSCRLDWHLATDDGSEGFSGNVVELLAARLDELEASGETLADSAAYAAGPEPMLEATSRVCIARGLPLQVSLEAHMGCGVGACRACGIVTYLDETRINGRVCREGPVFHATEIRWEGVGR